MGFIWAMFTPMGVHVPILSYAKQCEKSRTRNLSPKTPVGLPKPISSMTHKSNARVRQFLDFVSRAFRIVVGYCLVCMAHCFGQNSRFHTHTSREVLQPKIVEIGD